MNADGNGGSNLPQPATVIWVTVVASFSSYFLVNRGLATLVATIGGIVLTVVLIKADRSD